MQSIFMFAIISMCIRLFWILEVCVPDACAPHKVHVTMCTFHSLSYHLRDCDYFYFCCSTHSSFFMPSHEWVYHLASYFVSFWAILIFFCWGSIYLDRFYFIIFRRHFILSKNILSIQTHSLSNLKSKTDVINTFYLNFSLILNSLQIWKLKNNINSPIK